jgi:hypothetical protein
MGILNSKSRFMDTILTDEGRKQLAEGKLRAAYYSFSDSGMHYSQATIVSGGLDETYRIMLEAASFPQDEVTLKADDAGRLTGFPISGSTLYTLKGGQIFSSSLISGNEISSTTVTGSQFASLSHHLLNSAIDNFQKLYILRSPDPVDDTEKDFIVAPTQISFSITPTKPFNDNDISTINVNDAEGFFQDKRLSHIPNYSFLPPVNKPRLGERVAMPLGDYVNLNQESIFSFQDVSNELNRLEKMGYGTTVYFTETSRENNIFGQFFESSQNEMSKLDVIDFGSFPGEDGQTKHVFFIGKIFQDDRGINTFLNIFTAVFN